MPLAPKNFFDLITFTRSSTATYVGPDGLIRSAPINMPRLDHDPATGDLKGLLIEEARTNLLVQSSGFQAGNWSNAGSTALVTADAAVAPDGTQSADFVYADSRDNHHRRGQLFTGGACRFSIFAKAGGYDFMRAWSFSGGSTAAAFFDLENGVASGANNPAIESFGNGWYRCSLDVDEENEFVVFGPAPNTTVATNTFVGDGNGIYAWGAQLEEGSFATSYIPTEGSTVTRAFERAYIDGPEFEQFFSQERFTLSMEFEQNYDTNSSSFIRILSLQETAFVGNRIDAFVLESNDTIFSQIFDENAVQVSSAIAIGFTGNIAGKLAIAVETNNFGACFNGGDVVSDSSLSVSNKIDQIFFGGTINSASQRQIWIKNFRFFPNVRKSNAELQALTS